MGALGIALGVLFASAPETATSTLSAEAFMHQLMPCTSGLRIEYQDEPKEKGAGQSFRMIETVRGPGEELHTCVLDRLIIRADGSEEREAWAREMLHDRISNAGWVDRPVAFRTPLIRTPVEPGRRWHFNTTDFEIREVGDTFDLPAGTFEGCVRVVERSSDGVHEAASVYAPKVGLIIYESKTRRLRAVKVTMPGAKQTAQDGALRSDVPTKRGKSPAVRKPARKQASQESSGTSR